MGRDYKTLPFEIRKVKFDSFGNYEVTLAIKPNAMEQLLGSVLPFFEEVKTESDKRNRTKQNVEIYSEDVRRKFDYVKRVGMKVLRLCRKRHVVKEDILNDVAFTHDLNPQELLSMTQLLEDRRKERYIRFRDRRILRMRDEGYSIAKIAIMFDVSQSSVKSIIKQNAVRVSDGIEKIHN